MTAIQSSSSPGVGSLSPSALHSCLHHLVATLHIFLPQDSDASAVSSALKAEQIHIAMGLSQGNHPQMWWFGNVWKLVTPIVSYYVNGVLL